MSGKQSINPSRVSDVDPSQKIKPIPKARSLFMFTYENRFRRACHFISNHRWFSNSLLVCILVSSIMLAAEDPVNYVSKVNDVNKKKILFFKINYILNFFKILNKFDYFFTSVFTIEICLKLISYGIILHKGAFCRSLFNVLDLFVVIISLVSIALPYIMYVFFNKDFVMSLQIRCCKF